MENGYERYRKTLDGVFAEYGNRDVFAYLLEDGTERRRTFSELRRLMADWTETLTAHAVSAGDRAAILAPLSPNAIAAGLTLAYGNITAVLVDPSLPAEEINRLLRLSDVHALLTTEALYREIEDRNIPVFSLEHPDGVLARFPDSASLAEKRRLDCDRDVVSIIFSSGTTSSAKGVMYGYDSVLGACEKLTCAYGLTPGVRYFMVLPYNHISGYMSAAAFLLSADTICMIENLTPARMQAGFLAFQPHYFCMVPKVYDIMADKIREAVRQKGSAAERLLNLGLSVSGFLRKRFGWKLGRILFKPIYSRALGGHITGLAICGTICRQETAALFLAFGLEWANLYATTETNAPITTTGVFDRYPMHSVGRVDRFGDISVVIHQPNPEGIGEVYVKSPLMMKGYFREPALTADAFDGAYFKTGDLGYVDPEGYLFLVGRSKDVVFLHNGKKVSAADIDEFYQRICPEVNLACRGAAGADGFDTIHLFLETHDRSRAVLDQARRRIQAQSAAAGALYRIAAIHEIERIPLTAVGKVRRFLLEPAAEKAPEERAACRPDGKETAFDQVCQILRPVIRRESEITPASRLREDLGMDSLEVYELCAGLEKAFGISAAAVLHEGVTVGELAALVEGGVSESRREDGIPDVYPRPKADRDMRIYQCFMTLSRSLWRVEAQGLEHIRPGEHYLFCPNHESYLDGLWVAGCLDGGIQRDMCALAADHLFARSVFRWGLTALGGIPVQRDGNTAPAVRRAAACLASGKYHLLIHPEGTRTRSGQLGEFKKGAARLSLETGVKIIPVCISGAYEIFPPQRKLPRLFNWRCLRRYPLRIRFGAPVSPEGRTAEEITGELRTRIVTMKQEMMT